MGESWVLQEYECSFEGLVYPNFADRTEWTGGHGSKVTYFG